MLTTFIRPVRALAMLIMLAAIPVLSGCPTQSEDGSGTLTSTAATNVASLSLTPSAGAVKSDNSDTTTVTLVALSSVNSALSGVEVALAADTGILSAATVTTDADGQATFTFKSGSVSKSNRIATITASAGQSTGETTVRIEGSTVTAVAGSTTLVVDGGGSTATMTITARDAAQSPVENASVTIVKSSGVGIVTVTPSSGVTDANGQLVVSVEGGDTEGAVTLTTTALGATATTTFTVGSSAAVFAVTSVTNSNGTQPTLNPSLVSMKTNETLDVVVSAAGSSSVLFASSMGTWDGGASASVTKAVSSGTATARLATSGAGMATVTITDSDPNQNSEASFRVGMTAVTPSFITLQASPSTLAKSTGSTAESSVLLAKVTDANGLPVGGARVTFSMTNSPGGGEELSPVVVATAATSSGGLGLGEARASFTAGTLPSSGNGVQITATVVNTAISATAGINIGGTAGSIVFGQSTKIRAVADDTQYEAPMSIMVADSNGNPVEGAVVNLGIWPVAWNTGTGACVADPNLWIDNEDANENLYLDAGEDGSRIEYFTGVPFAVPGDTDGLLTPVNSAAGTVPYALKTDETGSATFNITYRKNSAIWTRARLRAKTIVQGTESVAVSIFPLFGMKSEVETECLLRNPYIDEY